MRLGEAAPAVFLCDEGRRQVMIGMTRASPTTERREIPPTTVKLIIPILSSWEYGYTAWYGVASVSVGYIVDAVASIRDEN